MAKLLDVPAILELSRHQRFVWWQQETRGDRPTKVPHSRHGMAKSDDASTWLSFDEAEELAAAKLNGHGPSEGGVGVMLGEMPDGGWLVGIDLDLCLGAENEVAPWARKILNSLKTYAETSPSGTGVKAFAYVTALPPALQNGGREITIEGATVPEGAEGSGHSVPELGIYPFRRFFTLTGWWLDGMPDTIEDCTEVLARICHSYFPQRIGEAAANGHDEAPQDPGELPPSFIELLSTDEALRRAWENGANLGNHKDTSGNGNDMALARYLRRAGLDDADIEAVIRLHVHGQLGRGRYRGSSADRIIRRILEKIADVEPGSPGEVKHEALRFIDWQALRNVTPPAREYLIAGMLPVGVVTSLYGAGGAGKSLVAQLLATCAAVGVPFIGQHINQCVAILVNAEDDDEELHRRQVAINAYLGIRSTGDHAGSLLVQGRMGLENDLVIHNKGKPAKATPLLEEITDSAREAQAKMIILDNAAHMFSGDEINRAEVTQFLNQLNRLARMLRAAVLLLGHPPKVPARPGGGDEASYSGSTAWWNNVRGLWTLDRIEKDSEIRRLKVLKANYGPVGAELRVRWHEGVMKSADEDALPLSQMDLKFKQHEVRKTVLAALDELTAQRIATSHINTARNYLPRVIVAKGLSNGFTVETLSRALDQLLTERFIEGPVRLGFPAADRREATGLRRTHPRAV